MPRSSFAKNFFRIFPPPAYLNMPYAGIDISDEAIRCLEFKNGKSKKSAKGANTNSDELVVDRYDYKALPHGAVEDGYIKDESTLLATASDMIQKLGVNRVRASLPEEKVYLFRTEIPSLDEKEIAQNIESKLEENVPLKAADAIFNFTVIPSSASSGIIHSASVSVVPAKVVEVYLRILKSAGAMVSSFEVQSRALTRALVPKGSEETIMLIYGMNSGDAIRKTGIYIVYRGVLCFSVTIPVENNSAEDISKGMREVVSYWLDHGEPVNAAPGTRNINRVIACVPNAMSAAVERVAGEMHIPVTAANVWTNAFSVENHTPKITVDESLGYAVAAGLALPFFRC